MAGIPYHTLAHTHMHMHREPDHHRPSHKGSGFLSSAWGPNKSICTLYPSILFFCLFGGGFLVSLQSCTFPGRISYFSRVHTVCLEQHTRLCRNIQVCTCHIGYCLVSFTFLFFSQKRKQRDQKKKLKQHNLSYCVPFRVICATSFAMSFGY